MTLITSQNKTKITSELRTANIFGVGVNAVSLAALAALFTAFSFSEEKKYLSRTNSKYKLPSFLFGFVLFLTAVTKLTAVLLKNALQLINAILEIAPRGTLFILSLISFVLAHWSLASTEWYMKDSDEEDNTHFCSNDLPLFPLYMQHDSNFYDS